MSRTWSAREFAKDRARVAGASEFSQCIALGVFQRPPKGNFAHLRWIKGHREDPIDIGSRTRSGFHYQPPLLLVFPLPSFDEHRIEGSLPKRNWFNHPNV